MNNIYSPIFMGIVYTTLRSKYFPKYTSNYFDPNDFINLGRYLEKEQVHPQKYIDFIFGILEYKTPLTPEKMIDPILVDKFRHTIHDQ